MKNATTKLDALINGTLKPEDFTHRIHLGICHAALCQFEFFEACRVVTGGLKRLAERARRADRYNATTSLTYMCIIADRMNGEISDTCAFLDANPDLCEPGLMARWYAPEKLQSALARATAVTHESG